MLTGVQQGKKLFKTAKKHVNGLRKAKNPSKPPKTMEKGLQKPTKKNPIIDRLETPRNRQKIDMNLIIVNEPYHWRCTVFSFQFLTCSKYLWQHFSQNSQKMFMVVSNVFQTHLNFVTGISNSSQFCWSFIFIPAQELSSDKNI